MSSNSRTCVIFLCLVPLLVHAGVVIESVEVDTRSGKSAPADKVYLQGGMARMEEAGGNVSILKGDVIYTIDKDERTYAVLDPKTLQQMSARMARMREQMNARAAKMPAAQRAQMEKAMGVTTPSKPPVYDAVDTGRTESIDGRSCRVWNLKTNGVIDEEYCVVAYSALPGKEDVQAAMRRMSDLLGKFSQSMSGKAADAGSGYLRAFATINGYPLRERDIVNGKPGVTETHLKSWREQAIPAAMFEPPAGYKRVDPLKEIGGDDDDE